MVASDTVAGGVGRGEDHGGSYYGALYRRKKARGGPKKVIMAVQHALLVAIWHMFSTGCLHEDLGPDHFRAS